MGKRSFSRVPISRSGELTRHCRRTNAFSWVPQQLETMLRTIGFCFCPSWSVSPETTSRDRPLKALLLIDMHLPRTPPLARPRPEHELNQRKCVLGVKERCSRGRLGKRIGRWGGWLVCWAFKNQELLLCTLCRPIDDYTDPDLLKRT